ncbi:Regulator [Neisseria gonorrhoeae]|uniref:Regulator n=1 Tax=Neisseria gonorrhoeae TaxID=485 RepID=A0A378VZ03_NEIGO|nr:Regulator [Neisseria gonorrhoeae]
MADEDYPFLPVQRALARHKILLLFAYIALGMVMMRARPRSTKFYTVYLLAMCCIACIVYLAKPKSCHSETLP